MDAEDGNAAPSAIGLPDGRAARTARIVAGGFSLLEAPRWRSGALYASDFYTRRVLRFDVDGSWRTIVEVEGQPSGLGWDPEGRLLISSMKDRRLLRLRDGSLEEVADLSPWIGNLANDMVVDRLGRAYVGNIGDLSRLGSTTLLRVDPDGTVTPTGGEVFFPNGICITPEGGTMLLAETFLGRISAYDVASDGSLENRRAWATFGSTVPSATLDEAVDRLRILPDGICLDAEGCLWVACPKSRAAYRVREGGEIVDVVHAGEQGVYAVCLGGGAGSTLFLCCAAPMRTDDHSVVHEATLRACEVEVPAA